MGGATFEAATGVSLLGIVAGGRSTTPCCCFTPTKTSSARAASCIRGGGAVTRIRGGGCLRLLLAKPVHCCTTWTIVGGHHAMVRWETAVDARTLVLADIRPDPTRSGSGQPEGAKHHSCRLAVKRGTILQLPRWWKIRSRWRLGVRCTGSFADNFEMCVVSP